MSLFEMQKESRTSMNETYCLHYRCYKKVSRTEVNGKTACNSTYIASLQLPLVFAILFKFQIMNTYQREIYMKTFPM